MTPHQKRELIIKSLIEQNRWLKSELLKLKCELPQDIFTRKKYFEQLIHTQNKKDEKNLTA